MASDSDWAARAADRGKSEGLRRTGLSRLQVPDLDAAFATLSERGVRFETGTHFITKLPDHELWMAFFRDPDENLLALMTEVRE